MPEYLKALVVVIGIAAVVFRLAAPILIDKTTSKADYWRRAAVWFAATAAAFLAHDFWVFAFIAGALLAFGGRKDRNPLAFYCALLCALPPLGSNISGLGVINYLFELNYLRLLSLVVLLPAAWHLFNTRHLRLAGPKLPDALLASYLVLLFILTAMVLPFTSALRQAFYLFIDTWLVYYVASRSVRDVESFRDVAAAFVLGATIMAVVSIFEAGRGWLLYSTLKSSLGVAWGYGNYMGRGVGGSLRAMASTGHPIVMGYLMVVTIPLLVFLRPTIRPTLVWWLTISGLVTALALTLSRGPWLGGVAMALIAVGIGKGAARRFVLAAGSAGVISGLALLSDWGSRMVEYLPFIGTVGSETVVYRQRLFEISISVLSHSPFFGEPAFFGNAAAQELRQGEGIIDMVNSYLGVAMSSGGVGFLLFVGLFASATGLVWRVHKSTGGVPETGEPARALLAAIAGILVTIGTTSSINVIPPIYLLIVGLSVGYCGSCLARRPMREVKQDGDPREAAGRAYRRPLSANVR
jgi:hypothetical protein